jgi:UDP-N-acetylmuramoyl-L-alanyl-D-glutamate--2,6-diaminopimelate ligase
MVNAENVSLSITRTQFFVHHDGERTQLSSQLIGRFNVYNILAAFAAGIALGMSKSEIKQGIESLHSVPGRFQKLESPKGWTAIVDYAHTPDALEKCLQTIHDVLPQHGQGKVITVFGAGGDRDKTKRPLMGRIVASLSDHVVVTSDNPRTEDPAVIMQEICAGISRTENVIKEVDRRKAIENGLGSAQPGDVVLIAGKGHEDYQVIGTERHHFSDVEVVQNFIGKQSL